MNATITIPSSLVKRLDGHLDELRKKLPADIRRFVYLSRTDLMHAALDHYLASLTKGRRRK